MLPTVDPSSQQFLNALDRIQTRLNTAQRQISSGLKMTQPSDAPDQVSSLLQLHADIQRNSEIGTELGRVKTEADSGESALSSAVDLMQRASVLATQATGPMQTASTRATLALEVQSLQEQMVSISRTAVGGRYIFSGDLDQSPAYQVDLTSATGVDRLQVSNETRQIQTPSGITFTGGRSANTIFDLRDAADGIAPQNVFAALNGLRVALLANSDTGIQSSIGSLQTASTYLNDQLGFYGQVQSRIADGLNDSQNLDVRLKGERSGKQDADTVAAIQDLTMGQTQLQAALTARAKMPRTSLFELL